MTHRIFAFLALFLPLTLVGNTTVPKYQYMIDLDNIVQDRVYVELVAPEIKKNKIRFLIPKVVPGTYQISDFGQFLTNFKAFDKDGNMLKAELLDINTFLIHDAKKLHKISYWVDDTFDSGSASSIYGMSGTNIEEGRGVVFNPHGFVGYFEDMKEMQFEMTIKKEPGHYGATAMTATYPDQNTEVYEAYSYNYLVDMPILYGKPDTTTVQVGETQVLIAINSPSGRATSEFIAKHFADVLNAESEYMGGKLPVSKYAFLLHFLSPGQQVGTGALEHNYSSLYVLPDFPQEQFIQPIKDIAAHEFFHIVSPLSVHSEEIRYFDFNDPKMSEHLWMYEGVTEYFSHHAQLVHGITDMDYFLNQMRNKIEDALSSYDDALPFTKLSKDCLTTHHAEYGNVYQKGALIGLCLDVVLRQESGGKMGLMDLMLELMQKFGKDQPFKDQRLFREIRNLSYPEASKFLKTYVDGKKTLPLKEVFNAIGVDYAPPSMERQFTYGNLSMGYNAEANRVLIASVDHMNAFGKKMGYQVGDEIVTINGKAFEANNPMALFSSEQQRFVEGENLVVEVIRKDATGQEKKVVLSAPIEKVLVPGKPSLKAMTNLTVEQQAMQAHWQQGAGNSGMKS